MSRLLVVHHTPSPATQAMLEVTGTPGRAELAALRELGATVAAALLPD